MVFLNCVKEWPQFTILRSKTQMNITSLNIGKPWWTYVVEEKPQREKLLSKRVAELKEQRELIDAELDMLRPPTPQLESDISPAIFHASINGFHNPKKHQGLTFNKFLILYKKRLAEKGTPYHKTILKFVEENEGVVIRYIKERFNRTLRKLG